MFKAVGAEHGAGVKGREREETGNEKKEETRRDGTYSLRTLWTTPTRSIISIPFEHRPSIALEADRFWMFFWPDTGISSCVREQLLGRRSIKDAGTRSISSLYTRMLHLYTNSLQLSFPKKSVASEFLVIYGSYVHLLQPSAEEFSCLDMIQPFR